MAGDSDSNPSNPSAKTMPAPPPVQPSAGLTSFSCPSCGAAVVLHAAGATLTAACSACGAICDNTNGTYTLVSKSLAKQTIRPAIALGTKGKLRGQLYQVIGFMVRSEENYPDQAWAEYLLYNPYLGFAWLSVYNGHWTLYKTTKNQPKMLPNRRSYTFHGETYSVFHNATAVVRYVIGEFYWQVRSGEKVKTLDAIHPPHIISRELSDGENVWSFGDYIRIDEIKAAFNPSPLIAPLGVAPNQPTETGRVSMNWLIFALAVILLFLAQIYGPAFKEQKAVASQRLIVPATGLHDTEIAGFSNPENSSHAVIRIRADVSQSYVTVNLRLVSDDPGNTTVHEFEKDFSYYEGYEDGEHWSEGDSSSEFLINALPRGHYRVLLSATPEPGHNALLTTEVNLAPHVWSNFWLAVFILLIYPAWMALKSRSFEHRRWDDSEFNPFEKEDD